MNLHQNIKNDYFNAMKQNNKEVKGVLALVIARINAVAKEQKVELVSDEDVIKAIQSELKQVGQSIDGAKKANRPDAEVQYLRQSAILEDYLPAQSTDEEINYVVESVIIELGEDARMGEIMKESIARLEGTVSDNSRILKAVREKK